MKIYLVGGAVRDKLLGREVKDKDYVVIGGKPEDLLSKGFHSVGKQFPVFIDPKTRDEYALGRKEIKVAQGHDGFKFDFGPNITLEEDLYRRDFTVNAMAEDGDQIIDPYGGKEDLKNKTLRHVSEHFVEDPLRVIRGFRFASILGFKIAKETKKLMEQMINTGELETLSSERVWSELKRVLRDGDTQLFFELCEEYGLSEFIFPSLVVKQVCWDRLKGLDEEGLFSLIYYYTSERDKYFEKYTVPKTLKKQSLLLRDTASELRKLFEKDPVKILDFFKRIRMDSLVLEDLLRKVKILYPNFKEANFYKELLTAITSLDLSQVEGAERIQSKQIDLIKSYL